MGNTEQRFNLGVISILELINEHELLRVLVFLQFPDSALAVRIVNKAIQNRHHRTQVNLVVFKKFFKILAFNSRDHTGQQFMQLAMRVSFKKGTKVLGLDGTDVDTFVMQFPNEIQNAITNSVDGHSKLVRIVLAILDFFLMDVGIKQVRNLLAAIELTGSNTQINSVTKGSAHLCNEVLGIGVDRADLHMVDPRDHLQILGI